MTKDEKSVLILLLTTNVLLLGDAIYRAKVLRQDPTDTFVVMLGVMICAILVFPQLARRLQRPRKRLLEYGGGVVIGLGIIALADYLIRGSLRWDTYLSLALGSAIGILLLSVLARLTGRRKQTDGN